MPSLADYAKQNPEVLSLLDGSAGHQTVAERLKAAGVDTSEASVRRYRSSTDWKPAVTLDVVDLGGQEDLASENDRLKTANKRLYKAWAKEKQKGEEYLQTLYNAVTDAAIARDPLPPVIGPQKDKRNRKKEEAALWHLTDWQGGKVTSSYNMGVMEERVKTFVNKAGELTEIMRADHPVRHCTILLGGDMIEGVNIFPGQVWEVEGPLFDQIFRVADLIAWAVREALTIYESVEVVGEWGNHGRLGKKSDGYKPSDNVDRIVYEIAKREVREQERLVDFKIWDKWFQHFNIGNYKGLLVHGDEIKSFGGNTPSYGILRKANSWASGVVPRFDDMYIGHYHQPMELHMANGGAVFMTGSTESDNEYAREFVAAMSKPSQRINFVDPERGRVTYTSNIWVAD